MHKGKNIYIVVILKKRDGVRQEVAQSRVPFPIFIQNKKE